MGRDGGKVSGASAKSKLPASRLSRPQACSSRRFSSRLIASGGEQRRPEDLSCERMENHQANRGRPRATLRLISIASCAREQRSIRQSGRRRVRPCSSTSVWVNRLSSGVAARSCGSSRKRFSSQLSPQNHGRRCDSPGLSIGNPLRYFFRGGKIMSTITQARHAMGTNSTSQCARSIGLGSTGIKSL